MTRSSAVSLVVHGMYKSWPRAGGYNRHTCTTINILSRRVTMLSF